MDSEDLFPSRLVRALNSRLSFAPLKIAQTAKKRKFCEKDEGSESKREKESKRERERKKERKRKEERERERVRATNERRKTRLLLLQKTRAGSIVLTCP